MNRRINFQLHVHTDRSFDCTVSVKDYIDHLKLKLSENDLAILGVADHNIVPFCLNESLNLSTENIIVIPGIQWRIKKTLKEALVKLCTRRELVTIGNHDDLPKYIKNSTDYRISKRDEILGNLSEEQLLEYISKSQEKILVVPHPRHFFFEFYGRKEIKELKQKIEQKNIRIPFFVEELTGYDPFPRIFYSYKKDYLTIGSSDAHEIYSVVGTNSFFAVEMILANSEESEEIVSLWKSAFCYKNVQKYKETLKLIFKYLKKENKRINTKKHYLRSLGQFTDSIPRWLRRRFDDFPSNFLK